MAAGLSCDLRRKHAQRALPMTRGSAECATRDWLCKVTAAQSSAGTGAHQSPAMRRCLGVQCISQLPQPQACSLPQLLMGNEADAAPL